MGSVVLAVTGAEALYADMGHFGRKPIGLSWLVFVMPALMLNYMGQGAMILSLDADGATHAIRNPFFLLAPEIARFPLIILATLATIIASQAVISGAFSVTQQAIHLGFVRDSGSATPARRRRADLHSGHQLGADGDGDPARPGFRSSSNLAAAYGIAVTGAMFIDGCLLAVVLFGL
jgi:KUP system potassium uptake protein